MAEKVYLVFKSYDDGMAYESMRYRNYFKNVVFKNESDARKFIEDEVLEAYYAACDIADSIIMERDAFSFDDGDDLLRFDVLKDDGKCIHYFDDSDIDCGNYWIEYKEFEVT